MMRKIVSCVVLALLMVSLSPAFGGTGTGGISHITQTVRNTSISLGSGFDNITINTSATDYSVDASNTMHPGTYSGTWDFNLDQSVFQSNISGAIAVYEAIYAATGNAPTAAEFQTYLSGMTEQYYADSGNTDSTTVSSSSSPQQNWDNMYNWVYNQWQSDWGRGSISSEPNLSSSSNTAGSSSGNGFGSTYTFSSTNGGGVQLLSGTTLMTDTNNVTTHQALNGSVNVSANGTTYAESFSFSSSPLVLDMTGNGKIEASGGSWLPHPGQFISRHLVRFDLLGDGFPLIMEWVGPDDGLLVDPQMGDCSMTHIDGTCLFGNPGGFANGYEKLETLDRNHDGKLTGAELSHLYVWQNKGGDAVVHPGELQSVQSLGISEIEIAHNNQMVGSFIRNGKSYTMWDWYPNAMEVKKIRQ